MINLTCGSEINLNMKNILITGGSGFIGTNLIEHYSNLLGLRLLNLDIVEPKLSTHNNYWKKVDIRDKDQLKKQFNDFQPEVVIHLAARTDLNGSTLEAYNANSVGVENLLSALDSVTSVKQVIFTSSMYVTFPGYEYKDYEDYAPHTIYGESKVQTEEIVKKASPRAYVWSIVRPTSIWGPWFGEPYLNFFDIIISKKYFHLGEKACNKTYGYIDNFIYQLEIVLAAPKEKVNRKVFYFGDYEPYNITEWANEIGDYLKIRIPTIPYFIFKCAGWFGDFLKKVGVTFPMTSFRLKNMTTDNIHNIFPIQKLAPNLPVSRKEGIKNTVNWLKVN